MRASQRIHIKNGTLYDPAQVIDGEIKDLYIDGDKFTEPFADPDITIDAKKQAVLAGGIDPFFMLATPGADFLYMNEMLPPLEEIGKAYAECGYTHIHAPLMTLLTARTVWHTLNRIPYLDKSAWAAIDFKDMGRYIKAGNTEEFISESRVLKKLTGAIGLFLAFPYLKHKQRHYMHMNISQKKTFEFIDKIEAGCGILPFHLWGQPGLLGSEISNIENFHITDAARAFTGDEEFILLEEFLNSGGRATISMNSNCKSLTADPDISQGAGNISFDMGLNHPLRFSIDDTKSTDDKIESVLKLLSKKDSKHQISISFPCIINDFYKSCMDTLFNKAGLTFYDYARLSRSEPARMLGLTDSGHLKTGGNASVAIFENSKDPGQLSESLNNCRLLIKDGVIVRKDGKFTGEAPPWKPVISNEDIDITMFSKADLLQRPTLRHENLAIDFRAIVADNV